MDSMIEETINDLNMLIDISCLDTTNVKLFEQFHNLLISLAYKATDVEIDYSRKRIHMNVLLEDIKGDYLIRYDDLMLRGMSSNLFYSRLKDFLKLSIKDEEYIVNYYKILKFKFLKGHAIQNASFNSLDKAV